MTQERDFDRVARAWLEAGPNEAPDRAVSAVLAAIETTPQTRRAWRWPLWRPITMTPRMFSLIGVLMLALVIGTAFTVGNRANDRPSPSPAASPSLAPGAYHALVGEWAGSPRTISVIGPSPLVRGRFTDDPMWDVSSASIPMTRFRSTAALLDARRLTLTTTRTDTRCQQGDVGTYDYQLSPGRKRLTLTSEADPCADRIAATQGTWIRTECSTGTEIAGGDYDCYGVLEAGTYPSRSANFRFDISGGAIAPITYGALTFTVPDGWAHVADNATRFWLMPADGYARIHDGPAEDGLFVFGHPQAASHDVGCPAEPDPGVGLTPGAIMASLEAMPALHLTAPETITINGRNGLQTDIRLADGWTQTCPWSSEPSGSILYANTGLSGIDATSSERLILLDIGHGDTVSIEIFASDIGRADAFFAAAMPVVESFVFADADTTN